MLQRNMLEIDKPDMSTSGMLQLDRAEGGGIGDLVNFALALLRRQYIVIILAALLGTAACLVYLLITPPTYTARVQLVLANPKGQFVQQQSLIAEADLGSNEIETQIQIIKSRAIAVGVIKQLGLTEDPDFNGSRPSLSSLLHRVRAWVLPSPRDQQSDDSGQPAEDAIAGFLGRLSANRISTSNVVEISFNSSNAKRAAEIANAVANTFIADSLKAKLEANRTATAWLEGRLREIGEQALTAERAVNAYKSENNLVSSNGKPIDEQQVTDLNSRLVAARAQTAEALANLNRHEQILRANSGNSSSIGTLDAGGSDSSNSPIINNLRQQYLELVRRESEWSTKFGRDNTLVIGLHARLQALRSSILEEVKRLTEISRGEYEVARQRQQEIEKQLAEAVSQSRSSNAAELTIRELDSRAKGARSLYETFLQRYIGSVQQESFPIAETRVIYPASPPSSKSKPKTALVLALGVFGGLAIGIALGWLRDTMDRVFRTSAQIEAALALPCLSLVPLVRAPRPPKSTTQSRQPDENLRARTVSSAPAVHCTAVGMPLSRFAEAIRSIKLAIDLNPTKTSNQVVGITSALPNEGKTTIAASLAQLIAHTGKSVIIVDCDLRNPSISTSLAPNAAAGLVEVIKGTLPLEKAIWRDPRTNLVFLPAVRRGPLTHTSEILCAEAMHELFARLRGTYDYIVVDLPPLTPLVDVRVTSPLVDCFLLVVEWGRSKVDVVQHALRTAPHIHECMIGAVFNKTDIKAMMRYDAYLGDYHSDKNYSHYGFSDAG